MIEYKGLKWTEEKDDKDDMPRFVAASSLHDAGRPFECCIKLVLRGKYRGNWRLTGDAEMIGVGPIYAATLGDAMSIVAGFEGLAIAARSRA